MKDDRRLWLFNPENDIALARNVKFFTPPPAAAHLAQAGALLPLWIAADDDMVMCDGVSVAWLEDIRSKYHIGALPWDRSTENITPTPWGWSLAARRTFEIRGFSAATLPDDATLARLRNLSHRRTAIALHETLAPMLSFEIGLAAIEVNSADDLGSLLKKEPMVVKAPWSSSGRGVSFSTPEIADKVVGRTAGIIKSQGSVLVEHTADKRADFALLFNYQEGNCISAGISLMMVDPSGHYFGNIVESPEALHHELADMIGEDRLTELLEKMPVALETVIGNDYTGPIGVDMLVDNEGIIYATIEINFRYTMGFVANSLARFVGRKAVYSVTPGDTSAECMPIVENGLLVEGVQALTPPNPWFTFRLSI